PNPKTFDDRDYIQRTLIEQGHWSIAEHGSATFYVTGVSRALTHELIRHRHLSFSELSQRFVNVEDAEVVYPPAVRGDAVLETNVNYAFRAARQAYDGNNNILTTSGFPRKQAREAARAVMPNATETKIVVTGNHRAWRDALGKRWQVAGDGEICERFGEFLGHFREVEPVVTQISRRCLMAREFTRLELSPHDIELVERGLGLMWEESQRFQAEDYYPKRLAQMIADADEVVFRKPEED